MSVIVYTKHQRLFMASLVAKSSLSISGITYIFVGLVLLNPNYFIWVVHTQLLACVAKESKSSDLKWFRLHLHIQLYPHVSPSTKNGFVDVIGDESRVEKKSKSYFIWVLIKLLGTFISSYKVFLCIFT